MLVNEPFTPVKKSGNIEEYLTFKNAMATDIPFLVSIMLEREVDGNRSELEKRTQREIESFCDGLTYGLFVAKFEERVIGFFRFYHSDAIPIEKVKFKSPKGYYAMGICVAKNMRRKGVAKFLSRKREEVLKSLGARELYSCVALNNITSQHMHKNFGFKQIDIVPGALTVKFDAGKGILYKKDLK